MTAVSGDRSGEVEPDAAALDELLRAFGPDDPDANDADAGDADELDEPDDDGATVISIADDELPDAVYVEGDLGGPTRRTGGSGVVFIEDDVTGDALTLDAAAAGSGGMEPRMRDRRDAVRRAAGRKRVRWAVALVVLGLVAVAGLAVLGSPLFAVDRDQILVTGAVYTDPDRLDAVIDDLAGTPVLVADTRSAETALEQIPWVDTARVRTAFPRSATIEIRERSPVATFQGPDERFRVIDRDGRVLDVIDGQPIAYMLVTGPDPADLPPGAFAPLGYAAAAEMVRALTPSVRGRVTSIDVTSDGSQMRLFLDVDADAGPGATPAGEQVEVRLGSATDLLVKLVRLENVLPTADAEGATLIDVSTAEVTLR